MNSLRAELLAKVTNRRLLLALDGISHEQVLERAKALGSYVAGGKVTDLIDKHGAGVLDSLPFQIKFLDPKINDIENTVKNRLRHYASADIVTVHASMGNAALRAAGAVGEKLGIVIVAVTVLTNIGSDECESIFGTSATGAVERFVWRAREAGLTGVVCSPLEVSLVRSLWTDALIITPGVRSSNTSLNDQSRTATPTQAIQNGADFIVMGRPILLLPVNEQVAQIERINQEVAQTLKELGTLDILR
jgi:orotidine-5'-phosphate decarboxylase